jgi:hypothetical protein
MIEEINYTRHTDGWIEIERYVCSELKTVSVAFDDLVEFCERNGYSFAIT